MTRSRRGSTWRRPVCRPENRIPAFPRKEREKKGKKKKIEKSKNNEATAAGLAVYMSQGPGGFKASPTPTIFLTRYHLIQNTDYKFVNDKMMVLISSKILKSLQYNLKIILNHPGARIFRSGSCTISRLSGRRGYLDCNLG